MGNSQRQRLGLIALIFVAAGATTLLVALYQAGSNIAVLKTWTPVEAQLVSTTIDNNRNLSSIQAARADNYLVNWTFRYNVAGAAHVAIANPGTTGNYSQMSKWAREFREGQTVTIHYKPDNPDVISAAQWNWITFAHAAGVAAWGFGIIVVGLVMRSLSRRGIA